jgi:hypothetical protein
MDKEIPLHIGAASAATHPNWHHIKPEWIRLPEAVRVSGLCKSSIWELIMAGKIKSFSHRKRGAVRGQRLISYDSLLSYLNAAAEAGI